MVAPESCSCRDLCQMRRLDSGFFLCCSRYAACEDASAAGATGAENRGVLTLSQREIFALFFCLFRRAAPNSAWGVHRELESHNVKMQRRPLSITLTSSKGDPDLRIRLSGRFGKPRIRAAGVRVEGGFGRYGVTRGYWRRRSISSPDRQ